MPAKTSSPQDRRAEQEPLCVEIPSASRIDGIGIEAIAATANAVQRSVEALLCMAEYLISKIFSTSAGFALKFWASAKMVSACC